jgi:hypothetical protein
VFHEEDRYESIIFFIYKRRIKILKGKEIKKNSKKCVKKNQPRRRPMRVSSRCAQQPRLGRPSLHPLPARFIPPRGYSQSRRRRPKPGAEAFVGLFFAGDEHPPGTPTPSLPFPSCCAELSTETLT